MLKRKLLCCLVSILFAGQALSCSLLSGSSIMVQSSAMDVCTTLQDKLSAFRDTATSWWQQEEQADAEQGYWEDWTLKPKDNPVISQTLSDKHFGVGFWLPQEYENQLAKMSTEEWLKSHGLLFSIGFGDKHSGEPRMRFDYRWHESSEADLMMQIEVPF